MSGPLEEARNKMAAARDKASAPLRAIKAKQDETANAIGQARHNADVAARAREESDKRLGNAKGEMNNAFGGARSKADGARSNLNDKQQDFKRKGDIVMEIIKKIESGGK